jgi:hypothetical protein
VRSGLLVREAPAVQLECGERIQRLGSGLRESAPVVDPTERELANVLQHLPRANEAGVKIVLGDDFGVTFLPHGAYAGELAF